MLVQDINIEVIKLFLKELPKERQYDTFSIQFARGRFKYKSTVINRLKKLING